MLFYPFWLDMIMLFYPFWLDITMLFYLFWLWLWLCFPNSDWICQSALFMEPTVMVDMFCCLFALCTLTRVCWWFSFCWRHGVWICIGQVSTCRWSLNQLTVSEKCESLQLVCDMCISTHGVSECFSSGWLSSSINCLQSSCETSVNQWLSPYSEDLIKWISIPSCLYKWLLALWYSSFSWCYRCQHLLVVF